MRSGEGWQLVVERNLVSHIDGGELNAPFVLVTADGHAPP